jgi:hypothetical protein
VGRWFGTGVAVTSNGVAAAANTVRLYPFQLRARITVSTLAVRVATVGLGSFQLAIYANDTATGRPAGAVLARTGNMSTLVADVVEGDITGDDVVLEAGLYWAATNVDGTSATTVFQTLGQNMVATTALVGAATSASASTSTSTTLVTLTTPMTFNTWSTMTGATFTEVTGFTGAAHIWLKAA